ncbi:MAG: DUF1553 domain-containing protein [Saprospiraceae bacterium]|nr:DUF1553 domain-containing protein [Saprospiraceae bacterium]
MTRRRKYIVSVYQLCTFISIAGWCINCSNKPDIEVDSKIIPEVVTYNFHIRPLLTDRCFKCHGPDEAARKGDLRLDQGEATFQIVSADGDRILVPYRPEKSVLWHRISTSDSELQMPPTDSKLSLTNYERTLIKRWIEQGAEFQPHWSFLPVSAQEPPANSLAKDLSPIGAFIDDKLAENELTLSSRAEALTLFRRVTLDLTGLSPTPEEVLAFQNDTRANAYEIWVDHLLETDAYAEHMSVSWLDLARYADSQGMHSDGYRSMFPWRDWVIQAFKENMPYDQFILEQVAGDLLPEASTDQLIATGFNRNHPTTAEGGVVDEEFLKEYAHDRVATTATVFLGLTMECARCHDHKYDPITQKDYYQFFAFFNQVDEVGLTGDDGNSGPNLLLPSAEIKLLIDSLKLIEDQLIENRNSDINKISRQKTFIDQLQAVESTLGVDRQLHLTFDHLQNGIVDHNQLVKASAGVDIREESGKKVIRFDSEYEYLTLENIGLFDSYDAFSGSVWIHPENQKTSQTIFGNSGQKGVFWRGWDFILDSLNRLNLRLIHALPHDIVAVSSEDPIPVNTWSHVAFTYDGSGRAGGVRLFINGESARLQVNRDQLQRSIYPIAFNKEKSDTPLRVGKSYRAFTGEYGIYEGMLDELAIYSRCISALEVLQLAGRSTDVKKLMIGSGDDNESLNQVVEWRYSVRPSQSETFLKEVRKKIMNLYEEVEEVMIMHDVADVRPTYILQRGNYDQPGLLVGPGTPKSVFAFKPSLPNNRLGLARWLLDPQNPLTSRVIVNRYWQHFFGTGLVPTSHDFGLQGQLPTHPELLDYLAYHFIQDGWNLKKLLKSIVMSEVYCQTSATNAKLLSIDPGNTLLSRGPSKRLTAEMLRDQALQASGLLVKSVGGPSVKPWQPPGLWEEKTSSTHILRAYEPDQGENRYRRSLYTFVRRTSMHPMMEIFDAPTRSVCVSKRQETNSPLQALVLLNDPQFVEAACILAQNQMNTKSSVPEMISAAYLHLCSREISEKKLDQLSTLYEEEYANFSDRKHAARDYLASVQYPLEKDVNPAALASLSLVVNSIMNLDDFYMKR